MRPTPLARLASSAARRSAQTFASTPTPEAGSSSSSQPAAPGRTLPVSTLRSLVALHHTSAGFLHAPADLSVGFENTFRRSGRMGLRSYREWAHTVMDGAERRPAGGTENLVDKLHESSGADLPSTVQKTFKKMLRTGWVGEQGDGVAKLDQTLTDRELRIQEALYGTWERGGLGMRRVEPGLDGVLEYLEAKGKTVKEYAEEWASRDEQGLGARVEEKGLGAGFEEQGEKKVGSKEDGM
ncbi:hypothetical protein IAT38_000712 [Cryptococcus sp. DSM 104549]